MNLNSQQIKKALIVFVFLTGLFETAALHCQTDPVNDRAILNELVYIEETDDVELGFDPLEYLPRGFNPHEKFFDIHSIDFIEETPEINFDFSVEDYLPRGFKAGEAYFNFLALPETSDFDDEVFFNSLILFIQNNSQKRINR